MIYANYQIQVKYLYIGGHDVINDDGEGLHYFQGGHRVDIIDHWLIINHFAKMVDVLEFVVDITLK